jgi:hypothetical protein
MSCALHRVLLALGISAERSSAPGRAPNTDGTIRNPLARIRCNDSFGVWLGFANHFTKECIRHYDLFVAATERASSPLMKSFELETHPKMLSILKSAASWSLFNG